MIRGFLSKIANIKDGSDINKTITEIDENISLRGYNVWILICSSVLASIGLDTNSVAVIIGAMLISPLMSPILGIGLAVGIHDNEMFRHSLRNLVIATIISLLASCVYFLISPFGEITAEISARTKPTILDVGVAFFGGVAGIVSISRRDKTNAIPGVAIATALMPPLCASGFGIAKGNLSVFLGAFYLFLINAVFISIATFLIVKYLKFPIKQYIDIEKQKMYAKYAGITIALLLIPSIYFLTSVYKEMKLKSNIENTIVKEIESHNNEVLKWMLIETDSLNQIKFYISGDGLTKKDSLSLQNKLNDLGLNDYKLNVSRVNISKDEVAKLSADITHNLIKGYEFNYLAQKQKIETNNISINNDSIVYHSINEDLRVLYPVINKIIIGKIDLFTIDSLQKDIPYIYLELNDKKSIKTFNKETNKIYNFIKNKIKKDTLILKYS